EPGRVGHEEGDLLGRGRLRGHDQVALVLPVLVVDHHHHVSPTDGGDGVLDPGESHVTTSRTGWTQAPAAAPRTWPPRPPPGSPGRPPAGPRGWTAGGTRPPHRPATSPPRRRPRSGSSR